MKKRSLLGSALLGAALACTTAFADEAPYCPPDAMHGPHGHGPHGHGMDGPPLMHQLHHLDLTDAQKTAVKKLLDAHHAQMQSQFESLRTAHQAFDKAIPGSSDFTTAQSALVNAEVAAARSRVEQEASLRTQIYAQLTDAQKAKWTQLASQPPPQPPPQQPPTPSTPPPHE